LLEFENTDKFNTKTNLSGLDKVSDLIW
jgi:hypothetical protein